MFGMGFAEMLIIGVIAILFLGPDKLPETIVNLTRTFRNFKRSIANAKASLEEEIHIEEIKREAAQYKQELLETKSELEQMVDSNELKQELSELKEEASVSIDDKTPTTAPSAPQTSYADAPQTNERVTFSKADTTTPIAKSDSDTNSAKES